MIKRIWITDLEEEKFVYVRIVVRRIKYWDVLRSRRTGGAAHCV